MVRGNAKRMNDANNWIVFVRGNHDNPAYFDGKQFKYRRFVAVPDYSIISAEALLRFESKTKGQIFPDQFIPVLEQTGLINEVGIWVVNEALRKCKQWREKETIAYSLYGDMTAGSIFILRSSVTSKSCM